MNTPVDLWSEQALDVFIAGLDHPNHSEKSRRGWCRLFLRDAALGFLRLASTPPDALDVERLGGALRQVFAANHIDPSRVLTWDALAAAIAREYVALDNLEPTE